MTTNDIGFIPITCGAALREALLKIPRITDQAHESPTRTEAAPLRTQLSAYEQESRTRRPDFAAAYDALVARLEALDRGDIGPKLGERMPPFMIPDQNGRLVSLESLLQSGPAVISLNRGHWCPYCKMELRSLAASYDRIRELGASAVAIMPETAQVTADYARGNELPFPVLSDIDLGYALSLDLIFWVGAEVQRLYQEAGVALDQYQGHDGFFLPMAAKFIVGRDGLVKARQVNIEFRERMEPEAIVAVLEQLHTGP
jgi:peroxiredoxin